MELTSKYLGLTLRTPIVVAASPLSKDIENIKKMEELGAGAVVLHSLFEEQIRADMKEMDEMLEGTEQAFAESSSFFPKVHEYRLGPAQYLEHIQKAKNAVSIPIIASLNGASEGGWVEYAKKIEEAGADALELNLYSVPTDTDLSGAALEERHLNIVKAVRAAVKIPVAVKLSPYYSNLANFAARLAETGVQGLVLFNRFMQPEVNLETGEVEPRATWSQPQDQRLPLRWVAILKGKVDLNLAATGGIHQAEDVIKGLMVGADVTMLCSSLLANGIEQLRTVNEGVNTWLKDKGYESLEQVRGTLSREKVSNPTAFERAQFIRAIGTELA